MNHLLRTPAPTRSTGTGCSQRFDRYWEVLFSHLLLYRFTYPCERDKVPERIMHALMQRTRADMLEGEPRPARSAAGTLISRVQYRHDLEHLGYEDGRALDEAERGGRTERDGGRERDVPAGGDR